MGMGGGGGGSSGKVDYPTYLKNIHGSWLCGDDDANGSLDTALETNIATVMNAAIGASPFAGQSAYNPTTLCTNMTAAATEFDNLVDLISGVTDWEDYYNAVYALTTFDTDLTPTSAESLIDAQVEAFNDDVDAEIESVAIPRFQRSMQDINAVVSSSFVLGQSLIEAEGTRRKAGFEAELRMQAWKDKWQMDVTKLQLDFQKEQIRNQLAYTGVDQIIKLVMAKLDYKKAATSTIIESQRLSIVAFKEQTDQNLRIDESDAKWDLEVFQYGGNLIAAIAGAATVSSPQKTNPLQSAIGGALSGVAAGAMVGSAVPGIGTTIGAGLGGLVGIAGSLFG